MLDAGALVQKHRAKGVLADTNLLVLLLVGLVSPGRIAEFKRTESYSIADFELLRRLISWFGKLIASPYVLAEVSNLIDLPGRDLVTIRNHFRSVIETVEEEFDPARSLTVDPLFQRFGLADSSIGTIASRGILVMTADLPLQLELQRRGVDALNFNHVRAMVW